MTEQTKIYGLNDRALIHITGAEAQAFLQNLVTCDMRRVVAGRIQYGCLLTAQGQLLHDFFVLPDGAGGYFLDCDAAGRDELIRRLSMYKLRAKVSIAAEEGWKIYSQVVIPAKAGIQPAASAAHMSHTSAGLPTLDPGFRRDDDFIYDDPRLPELGHRIYTQEKIDAASAQAYDDLCISLCVPPARAAKTGRDFLTSLNLDLLNGVDWDKGCFVGQEVAARMEHRGLVKRRLVIVEGRGLAPADRILSGETEAGEIRAVDSHGRRALALLKLESLQTSLLIPQKDPINIHKPIYPL